MGERTLWVEYRDFPIEVDDQERVTRKWVGHPRTPELAGPFPLPSNRSEVYPLPVEETHLARARVDYSDTSIREDRRMGDAIQLLARITGDVSDLEDGLGR
jgi:hypothetical protein